MPPFKTITTALTFSALLISLNTAFSLTIKETTQVKQFNGGVLNVRFGSGKRIIYSIKSGTSDIEILKTVGKGRNKWTRIKWAGKVGWVSADYLEKAALVDTTKTYQVNASKLNLRKGAGRNNSVLGTLPRGTTIKIIKLEKVKDDYWANISQAGKEGWVSAHYLKVASGKDSTTDSKHQNVDDGDQMYTVVKGDTLYAVQRKTGKNWKRIAELNSIQPPYTLQPGEELIMWLNYFN